MYTKNRNTGRHIDRQVGRLILAITGLINSTAYKLHLYNNTAFKADEARSVSDC